MTIAGSNTTAPPARNHANEGIRRFRFLQGSSSPEVGGDHRAGMYLYQRGVALPKL